MRIHPFVLMILYAFAWYGLLTLALKLIDAISGMMNRYIFLNVFGYKKTIYLSKEIILNKILKPFNCEVAYVSEGQYYSGRWKTAEIMMSIPGHTRGAQALPNARMVIRKKPTKEV